MIMEVRQFSSIDDINKHLKAFRNMEVKDIVTVLISSENSKTCDRGGFERTDFVHDYIVTFQEVKDDSK